MEAAAHSPHEHEHHHDHGPDVELNPATWREWAMNSESP